MIDIELRWLIEKRIPFDRLLQWRVKETDEHGNERGMDWTNVPVVPEM